MDAAELARRSVANYGEMLAVIGDGAGDRGRAIRRADAVGARIPDLAGNPWLDAVVVPFDLDPPEDDPDLSSCIWASRGPVGGRIEDPAVAMPCMGLPLDGWRPTDAADITVGHPGTEVVGAMSDRAYGSGPALGPLAARIDDNRVETYGLVVDGRFVCSMMTLRIGDDLGIHYVATEADCRRRGLATALVTDVLVRARADGLATATLQASPDGFPIYAQMGFAVVGRLQIWTRPGPPDAVSDRLGP